MEINQILPGFMPGDAISAYALELQKIFCRWGYPSQIFVPPPHIDARFRHLCFPLRDGSRFPSPDDILIYHLSIGSEAARHFQNAPGIKVVIYHNITPAGYFFLVNPEIALRLKAGRQQLQTLAGVTDLALGVSEYNRGELERAGFNHTGIIPLTLDWPSLDGRPHPWTMLRHRWRRDNILFVGRVAPNKKIEDLLQIFFYLKIIKPRARLFIVGNQKGYQRYLDYLRSLIQKLSLKDVIFAGHTAHSELLAYYHLARVFLCLSEHEGFCLPLLESMHYGIPVMAYAAAAVPDTLNGAGVLIKEKNYPEIAEMVALLCNDARFREAIIAGQFRRLEEFKSLPLEDKLKKHLGPWLKLPSA